MSEVTATAAPAVEGTPTEGIAEGTDAQQATPEQKQAIAAMKERFKYTVDGEDFEEEIDFADKEALRKRFQMGHAAQKKMAEAKAAKAKAFDIVKQFEEDPANILKRLGPKGRELAEKFLLEQIQEDMLSPEEKEMRMTKAELAKYKAQEAKAKEDAEKSEMSAKEKYYADEFQKTIVGALEKLTLPKSPQLVKRMAGIMSKNLELGLDLSADELAVEVKNDLMADLKGLIGEADGDQLLAMFGEDVANRIRKSDLRKLQEKHAQVFQPEKAKQSSRPSGSREKKPMTMDQWRESVNQRLKS